MAPAAATVRLLVCALAVLGLAFASAAAPAHADHWHDRDGEPAWDGDGGWDEVPDEQLPEGVLAEPAPEPLPEPIPAPDAWPEPDGRDAPAPWSDPEPPAPIVPEIPIPKAKIIKGTRALVRADGTAAIPRGAPKRVRVAIAAANKIVGKPYKWGGGHARLTDSGYDCSGTVGFSLVHAGLMPGVMVSGRMARWGSAGDGRWVTVYANKGHVYMEIAGLRLDTSAVGDPTGRKGPRWRPAIGRRPGFAARHPAGL